LWVNTQEEKTVFVTPEVSGLMKRGKYSMSREEKLELAVKALEMIRAVDGWGADLSPPGPCFNIADEALIRIRENEVYKAS